MNLPEIRNSLSIVIPALNERKNLELLLPGIIETLNEKGVEYEILLVDSNSEDGTELFVRDMAKNYPVKYLNEPTRGNLALAWDLGIMTARYQLVVTMDADMCHTPSVIPELLESLQDHDMVIASRYLNRGRQMTSKNIIFEIISRGGQWFCRFAMKVPYTDISHGFRIFRKDVYVALRDKFSTQGNSYMIDFVVLAQKNGYSIHEIPYTYGKRKYGKDKMRVLTEMGRALKFLYIQLLNG